MVGHGAIDLEEFATYFRRGLIALLFNLGGVVAGLLLATNLWVFGVSPWAVLVYPGVMSVRGAVAGLSSGHISTGLNVGLIRTGFRGNTRRFYVVLGGVMLLTVFGGAVLSSLLALIDLYLNLFPLDGLLEPAMFILTVLMASTLITFPLTALVGFISFNRGADPDYFVYPIMSSSADILVTVIYISTAYLYSSTPHHIEASALLALAYTIILAKVSRGFWDELLGLFREGVVTVLAVSSIVYVTGMALKGIYDYIGRIGGVYLVYPAMLSTVGDVGSILGSRFTTKVASGEITPKISSILEEKTELLAIWASSLTVYAGFALLASAMNPTLAPWLTQRIILVNLIVMPITMMISYATGVGAALHGWNPDSFVIPIESTLADAITATTLYTTLLI